MPQSNNRPSAATAYSDPNLPGVAQLPDDVYTAIQAGHENVMTGDQYLRARMAINKAKAQIKQMGLDALRSVRSRREEAIWAQWNDEVSDE